MLNEQKATCQARRQASKQAFTSYLYYIHAHHIWMYGACMRYIYIYIYMYIYICIYVFGLLIFIFTFTFILIFIFIFTYGAPELRSDLYVNISELNMLELR